MSAIKSNPSTRLDHHRYIFNRLDHRAKPPVTTMTMTTISVASERGALVCRLVYEQNELWSHIVVTKIRYDDETRTYTCWLAM